MLLLPFSAVTGTVNNPNIKNEPLLIDEVPPELFLTQDEYNYLSSFIESHFEGIVEEQAKNIVKNITVYNSEEGYYKLKINNLIKAIETYSYYKIIPDDELKNVSDRYELKQLINAHWDFSGKVFGNLINEIINLIKLRLGWFYRLFSDGGSLFVEGVNLAIAFIDEIQNLEIAKLFTYVVNLIVYIPIYYFSESIKNLFNLNLSGFNQKIDEFINLFSENLTALIQIVEDILITLGEKFQTLVNYISDIGDFVSWLANGDPWEQQITVKGIAFNLFGKPIDGATVICKGISTITNSTGEFEFKVNSSNNSIDSIPPNSWYGIHNCVITISIDGEVLKQTPTKLSYVFSGGEISWPFIILKVKNKVMPFKSVLLEKINIILDRFFTFFLLSFQKYIYNWDF